MRNEVKYWLVPILSRIAIYVYITSIHNVNNFDAIELSVNVVERKAMSNKKATLCTPMLF